MTPLALEAREMTREPSTREMLDALKEVVRRAVQVMLSLRDSDYRYLSRVSNWGFDVSDDWFVYGMNDAREARFIPTPRDLTHMEIVAGWLSWLRRTEGEKALRRLFRMGQNVPTWRMALMEKVTERTILNRIERSLSAILKQFGNIDAEVPVIEERGEAGTFFFVERADWTGEIPMPAKVYVHGIGWMKNGRKWDTGSRKAERFETA